MKFVVTLMLLFLFSENPIQYNLFQPKANRLIVITDPSWCSWCKMLDPHLVELKKDGYKVHTYTKNEWKKVKPKPSNLPKKLDGSYGVPVVLYVKAKENKVVKDHGGGKVITAGYIKRYLTK